MLTKEAVEKVAVLSRLKLSEAEVADYSKVLSAVLENFEQIATVDTTGISPLLTPTDITHILREDTVVQSVASEKLLENTPEKSGRLFKVPPVV
jgi:aspartyl-tRNA(Asn)/glutamyl-tRNA(Gln) amidotransferase subunit C